MKNGFVAPQRHPVPGKLVCSCSWESIRHRDQFGPRPTDSNMTYLKLTFDAEHFQRAKSTSSSFLRCKSSTRVWARIRHLSLFGLRPTC
jgi:hypothetical protein